AKTHRDSHVPTLEQIRHVIRRMPAITEIERRDRALIAFTILTGARDGAIASLKLKHIDIDQRRVDQDARQVKTKFAKSFTTWFFPVGHDIREIVGVPARNFSTDTTCGVITMWDSKSSTMPSERRASTH